MEMREEMMVEEITLEKNRKRQQRRKMDFTKAVRKKKISESIGIFYYDNLHSYSKNKIHCSCPLCAFSGETASDKRKRIKMEYSLKEYLEV